MGEVKVVLKTEEEVVVDDEEEWRGAVSVEPQNLTLGTMRVRRAQQSTICFAA